MRFYKIFTLFLLLFVLAGCSTKKNTAYRRAYHNITSKYNVYFYAKEAYKAGLMNIDQAYVENYNDIIPVFKYSNTQYLSSATSDMETAILKCSKLIKIHSLTVKPKRKPKDMTAREKEFYNKREFNKWVDDAYLLMGKSYFYKDDKYSASKNFEFVISESKKQPMRFPAMLWMARTKNEIGQTEDAIEILNKAKAEPDFPEELISEYSAIYADAMIKDEAYADAIPLLEDAIANEKKKKVRVRYTFILAQLHQKLKNGAKAMEYYEQVVDMNPPYDMAFSAKIKMATAFDGGNSEDIVKLLKKLLRDEKNKEFRDQIYFALANISYQEGNIDEALDLYIKSASVSDGNDFQKAMSYLSIGEIYYDRRDYLAAQPYYDSSVTVLPQTYKNYEALSNKSTNLNDLAAEFKEVKLQDSLQAMAKMPKRDLELMIEDAITKLREEEAMKRELAEIERQNSMMFNQEFGQNGTRQSAGAQWYFYNPTTLKYGKTEFQKKWGGRKLEDNWRRSNKEDVDWLDEEEELEEVVDSLAPKRVENKMTAQYYLQDIPFSDSAMLASHDKIKEALLVAGIIFMDRIEDSEEAIRVFKDLAERYPEYDQMPMVYYFISLLYADMADDVNAEKYRNKVISDYPDSKYAQALTNPNYFREIRSRELTLEKMYRKAYKHYFRKNYSDVIAVVDSMTTQFPDNPINAKYQFLRGLSVGKMTDLSTLKKEMVTITDKFPDTESSELAKDILKYIATNEMKELPKDTAALALSDSTIALRLKQDEEEREIYALNEMAKHSFVFVAKHDKVDFNRLKFNMINYNLEYFSNFNFSMDIMKLDDMYSTFELKSFVSAEQAYSYYDLINISPEIFDELEKSDIEYFVISQPNMKVFKKDTRVEKYLTFFFDNYQR